MLRSVAVYCGSSSHVDDTYLRAAAEFGSLLAARGIVLVYGGATCGLMGALADAALAKGGRVVGVVPRFFSERLGHKGLSEQHVVDTMHERKALMFNRADACVALPGGLGTLDEFVEVLTWAQIGHHGKPCGLLNTGGYYDLFLRFLDHAVSRKFINRRHLDALRVASSPEELVNKLDSPL